MTTADRGDAVAIPAALQRWAEVLAELDPYLATALGPMLRRIDEVVSGTAAAAESDGGEPAGYGGLVRRGVPELLTVSQWALADAAPLEFLRRAATSELLYLEPARVAARSRGRIAVLVDSGPEVLGAARLVQLATLIVLAGRAERAGAELQLGVLDQPTGTWCRGRTGDVLRHWLRSRTVRTPADIATAVADWTEDLDAADEVWVLTGPRAAAALADRRRLVVAREVEWTERGAAAVDTVIDGRRVRLALPEGDAAVRALRGVGLLRRTTDAVTPVTAAATEEFAFTGAAPVLLVRGAEPASLVRIAISPGQSAQVKSNRLSGPLHTAAVAGRRVLALVRDDERGVLRAEVIGKPVSLLSRVSVNLDVLPRISDTGFAPLVFDGTELLTCVAGQWWRLGSWSAFEREHRRARRTDDVLAVRATRQYDRPLVARRRNYAVAINERTVPGSGAGVPVDTAILGGDGLVAWSSEAGRWRLPGGRTIELDEGERVLGLHEIDGAPALIVCSASGLLLRLRWPAGMRTLTAWSSDQSGFAVHPTRPWVAVRRGDGAIEVGDLTTSQPIARIEPS